MNCNVLLVVGVENDWKARISAHAYLNKMHNGDISLFSLYTNTYNAHIHWSLCFPAFLPNALSWEWVVVPRYYSWHVSLVASNSKHNPCVLFYRIQLVLLRQGFCKAISFHPEYNPIWNPMYYLAGHSWYNSNGRSIWRQPYVQ